MAGDASIAGIVWNDLSGDGTHDAGEPLLENWTVYLDLDVDGQLDAGEPSTVSDAGGEYEYSGLAPGSYAVAIVPPSGWRLTSPLTTPVGTAAASVTAAGAVSNSRSDKPALSADGRFVAFESDATNIVAGAGGQNIFVRDRQTGITEWIDRGLGGAGPNNTSFEPSISADGRFVAFQSYASNLVSGDGNGQGDVFVFDRQTQTMTRVSVSSTGEEANGASRYSAAISGNGRFVAFRSEATNLVAGDTNAVGDVFVHDLQTGVTERVSVGSGGQANRDSDAPSISGDGRYVAFESDATNLVTGDTNGTRDIFVRDRLLGTTRRVTVSSSGTQANSSSQGAAMSAGGQYVGYWSNASNLASGDTNGVTDVFVHDLQAQTTERVSLAADDGQAIDYSTGKPSLSDDGRYVAFVSDAPNLAPGDANHARDVFIRDRIAGVTRIASLTAAGGFQNGGSNFFTLSGDGAVLAFGSDATNVVPGDTNNRRDVFVAPVGGVYRVHANVVSVASEQTVSGVDLGAWQPRGQIAGVKWKDRDRDLVRDPQELLLPDWQIYLDANDNGQWDDGEPSRLTDANGAYSFAGLEGGTYKVRETLPADWLQFFPGGDGSHTLPIGAPTQFAFDFEDLAHSGSSVTVDSYRRNGFTFSSTGQSSTHWTIYGPGSAANYTGSAALKSTVGVATLWLARDDQRPFTMRSIDLSSQGQSGTHSVTFVGARAGALPVRQTFSIDASMQTYVLTGFEDIVSLEWRYTTFANHHQLDNVVLDFTSWSDSTVDFGNMIRTGEIRGVEWRDLDRDGQRDADDPPLPGWTLFLDANGDGVRNGAEPTAVTNANGEYAFLDLEPATYLVASVRQEGYEQTSPGPPPAGSPHTIDLAPGQIASGVDHGFYAIPAEIRGRRWHDRNANGRQDANEEGLAERTLYLDLSGNGQIDAGEPTATTDANGDYAFLGLETGHYIVAEIQPEGWAQTYPGPFAGGPERASIGDDEAQAIGTSVSPALSGDGRYVAFVSGAGNLVAGDTNRFSDVFVRDRQSGTTERVSVTSSGAQVGSPSSSPSLSGDGRYVAFASTGVLVAGDSNGLQDIFVRDCLLGLTTRVSLSSGGTQADGASFDPMISADGRFIAFTSSATNLVANDGNGRADIFVHDRSTGATVRANVAADGAEANEAGAGPAISGDGRYIAFVSLASNLVASDDNNLHDVFVKDLSSGAIERVEARRPSPGEGRTIDISDDGRFVTFSSVANDLVAGDVNGLEDVFLVDRDLDQIERVTIGYNGLGASGFAPQLDASGRYVAFLSSASNLVRGDTNGQSDLFVRDRQRDVTQRLGAPLDGLEPNGGVTQAAISDDGRQAAYASSAFNLVAGDTNQQRDVFVQANPVASLPGTYWQPMHVGETALGADFGDWVPFNVVLHSVRGVGAVSVDVTYEIQGAFPEPFDLRFFRSPSANLSSSDELLDTVSIQSAADLTVGLHTINIPLGSAEGQVALPGAGAADSSEEYYLFASASLAGPPEDDAAQFTGVYLAPAGVVYVHGSETGNTIRIQSGGVTVQYDGANYTYASGAISAIRIWGHSGDDSILGATATLPIFAHAGAGADRLTGGKAADTLIGGEGDDILTGGAGDDLYLFDADGPLGADVVTDSKGVDTIDFSATSSLAVAVHLGATSLQTVNANLSLSLSSASAIERAYGGAGDDSLTGNTLANMLRGGAGNDHLSGAGGTDTLEGGEGDDLLVGGAGNDTYLFDADNPLGADVVDEAGGGVDTLDFAATTSLAVNVNLSLSAQQAVNANVLLTLLSATTLDNVVGGALGDVLTGNSKKNALTGNAGEDTLSGLGGADLLIGGAGNDSLVGGAADDAYLFDADSQLDSDTIDESAATSGGVDTLDFAATTSQTVTIDLSLTSVQVVNSNLSLRFVSGESLEWVIGGALGDTITGNGLQNLLLGGQGDDVLVGGQGRDMLVGGSGADLVRGGFGDDVLIGGKVTFQDETTGAAQPTPLLALLKEWKRGDADYATRVAHLLSGGGLNGVHRLNSASVQSDGSAIDELFGDDDLDWFLTHADDLLGDLAAAEIETAL